MTERAALADPSLGGIAGFTGTFRGNGLNTIFRPQDFAVSPTPLPKPAHGPNDNILELNLTEESLAFSDPLGSIPNRGFVQGDAFLNGIPYVQKVKDVSDPAHPVDIHFEPGVWLSVPKTDVPEEEPSVARMGSIPHGTTIEAQGTSFTVSGGPRIDPVDITPFPIGDPNGRLVDRFPSQDVADEGTFRIPQDLSSFVSAGTITKEILANPNLVIDERQKKQHITSTTVIIISTDPAPPLFGGGTDNIAFLLGDKNAAKPNADAVQMTAIFWVETVSERITLPAPYRPGVPIVVPGSAAAGNPVPSFAIHSDKPIAAGTHIDTTYTQIQYTQTVLLNFNGLSWPHVSVATLVPEHPVPVSV
ncbi:MAG TPA: heme-binding protein [Actinomycetospora sp.]|uniref:heme-binding protein n=1 Tax=Actinomycetospora sp. TaxID=1872135 RepID=UPI002F424FB7